MRRLLDLPKEILERIALLVSSDGHERLGPPTALIPLLLTSKQLNHTLSPTLNTHLGSRIFREKFDHAAILRRQPGLVVLTKTTTEQLVMYCNAMRILRTGNVKHEKAEDALWVAFLMLLENDFKNAIQLAEWAKAYEFARRWVFERIFDGSEGNRGWPLSSNANGIALWVLWMLTTEDILQNESLEDRQRLIDTILPFCVMSYRYPSFHCPPNHFVTPVREIQVLFPTLPQDGQDATMQLPTHPFPYSLITAHGPYPLYLDPSQATVKSWWALDIPFSQIACGLPSSLLYFCRRDRILPLPGLPLNRADAIAQGREGVTAEDVTELASYRGTILPPRQTWDPLISTSTSPTGNSSVYPYKSPINPYDDNWNSARWDVDWIRWTSCIDPRRDKRLETCIPFLNSRPKTAGLRELRLRRPRRECYDIGSLAGLWQGKFILPGEDRHVHLLTTPNYPRSPTSSFGEEWLSMLSFPILMRLREYHCLSPKQAVPKGQPLEGSHPRGNQDQPPAPGGPAGTTRVSRLPGFDDGAQNAWLPWGTKRIVHSDSLIMTVDDQRYVYQRHSSSSPSSQSHDARTCLECQNRQTQIDERECKQKDEERMSVTDDDIRSMASSHEHLFESAGLGRQWDNGERSESTLLDEEDDCTGVTDIIFVGETDHHHGQAWRPFYFYGRLRRWDGLIGLLRVASTPGFATMFFHGYLVGSRNLVGQWRMASTEMGVPAWMCAFSMSKREDD